MVKKFTIPFASQGDANDIPDALQVDGKVSFTQGFGYDYERPYDDPQAKDIAREDMNGLFKAITSAVGELQTLGASEWSSAISYPKGAIVYHEKDLYISQVDDNQNTPPQNWVSITSIANDSLKKAANLSDLTNKATARNNLGLGSSATLNKTDTLGTSSNLIATQKLVNDTKINLESSKQDKLTFVGNGPEVMKTGAYGLGIHKSVPGDNLDNAMQPGFYAWREGVENAPTNFGSAIVTSWDREGTYSAEQLVMKNGEAWIRGKTNQHSSWIAWNNVLTNTHISQSTGSSTTSVMSQKAVTDRLNAIESGHGLGYGQSWVDVTSQRVAGTTYTNNTGKPIMIAVTIGLVSDRSGIIIDGTEITTSSADARTVHDIIIPKDSTYMVRKGIVSWSELR